MARQNLFCNGIQINSIQDLWDNFNLEDLTRNISVGRLQQWLFMNGFFAEYEMVQKIDCNAVDADCQLLQALKFPKEKQDTYFAEKKIEEEKRSAMLEASEDGSRPHEESLNAKIETVQEETGNGFLQISDKCIGCTLCKRNCPVAAISGELKKKHHIKVSLCTDCGICVANCRQHAILYIKGPKAHFEEI